MLPNLSYGLEINFVYFFLVKFYPKNTMSQLSFYNIDYSGSYRSFQSIITVDQNKNIYLVLL